MIYVFNTLYSLKKKNKKENMIEIDLKICAEKETKTRKVWKKHKQNISEEDKRNNIEYIKEYQKISLRMPRKKLKKTMSGKPLK